MVQTKEQHYKNHTQIVYGYYLFTGIPILVLIGVAIAKLFMDEQKSVALILLLIGWILLSMLFRSRSFALKAQDRAIRAEENLRYFILTGKRLDQRLAVSQIIALRFAGDEEMPALAQRAVEEGLTNDAIKKQIKNWRSDWHRV
ncbi:MAG: DUF6526 family protein [Flavisolibacter sp.]